MHHHRAAENRAIGRIPDRFRSEKCVALLTDAAVFDPVARPQIPRTAMAASDHKNPWDSWYDSARWQHLRARQLMDHPLCTICAARGIVVPATVVDHVIPHKGDWTAFVGGRLQSLCRPCHDGAKRVIELRGYSTEIGLDGWPTDPKHPAYAKR